MVETPPYAPRDTTDLYGQTIAEAALLEAWRSGRLHHAWLMTGPPGIGKATLAYRFARFLLSREPAGDALFAPEPEQDLFVAPDHPVARRISAGSHPDLMSVEREIDAKRGKVKSAIGVDQVRSIAEFMHLTAGEGGWRIVLLDPVDDLNTNAANALLKVLEEPPRRALLLLVSHAPGRLLPTIRSRCRTLALDRLGESDLGRLIERFRPGLVGEERRALIELAEGSAGRALDLAEGGHLQVYGEMVGLLSRPADIVALHAFADKLARPTGEKLYTGFQELWGWWLSRVIRCAARGTLVPEIVPGEAEAGRRLVERLDLDRLAQVWEKTTSLMARGDAINLDRKQMILNAFLALAEGPTRAP